MLQNIIVFIIIAIAVGYTVFAVIRSLHKKEKTPCDGCNGCDLKSEVSKQKEKYRYNPPDCYNS